MLEFWKGAEMALKDKNMTDVRAVDPALADSIRAELKDDRLDCVRAFVLADAKGITPLAVGGAADSLGVHLSHCQLGLFGFPGHAKAWETGGWKEMTMPEGFKEAIRSSLDPDGSLSCSAAWTLAARFGLVRAQAGFFASRLNVKIKHCQLGAF
ncbi:MAG TPA: hypothetical protein PLX50_02955 [Candidatus Aminicenantes bacterium]|nr:hypothetical protein [Candidatus Aminicenantes bacterium]